MVEPNSFVEAEKQQLITWEEQRIFERTLEQRASSPTFSFYDGPPFANGLPHYGHMLVSVIKDTVIRYWTMRGYRVERTFGWDCHGLPVENEVEKELKIKSKSQIEKLSATPAASIAEFGRLCRVSVLKYQAEWRAFMRRIGRWADHTHEYATLDNDYIGSVWWALAELFKKDLVYQDYRVSPYCPRCGTPLSNFEVNQGYKKTSDHSVFVKFRAIDPVDNKVIFNQPTFFVAWTTTPWTLPGNVALAVNLDITYVAVKVNNEVLWLAKDRLDTVAPKAEVVAELPGSSLVGAKYQPLFEVAPLKSATSYHIYPAEFVTTGDGSGIVHTAVMYGEDDFNLGKQNGLPMHHTVDTEGKLTAEVPKFGGKFVKDANFPIILDLEGRGLLLGKEAYFVTHEYPFCYRCDSPLIYYALSSWFIKVTAIKDQLVGANNDIHWIPAHVKEGRFGKWLEGARDWAVSRNRYWGAPLPIWQCVDCHATKVLSDPAELASQASIRNHFFLLRHGEAENNVLQILASEREGGKYGLTDLGKQQVAAAVEQLQAELKTLGKSSADVRLIISPIRRAQETAKIIAATLKLVDNQLITDSRVRELDLTSFDGQAYGTYEAARAAGKISSGVVETPEHITSRIKEAVTEFNSQTTGLVYVVVSHGDPLWLLEETIANRPAEHTHQICAGQVVPCEGYPGKAELRSVSIPWLDLHRPYIDEITFLCACGGTMQRVPEVFDCWFESGSMPYAQYGAHTRAAADDLVVKKLIPADFIAEGLDQTRGWFYTLHVLAVALFGVPAYKNVVVNGLILASDGKKLSKRLKNYTPPDELFGKWGVDPVRYFLLASTAMGEDYRFTDEGVQQSFRQVIQLLWNVTEFYQLYKPADQASPLPFDQLKSTHVMDRWLVARLSFLVEEITKAMDQYDLTKASRQLGSFVDDLSTWYIRRSRDRIKSNEENVVAILQSALHQLSIVMAPFMPFMAERVYHAVGGVKDSVHLEDWIVSTKTSSELLDSMEQVRAIAETVHALRSSAKIKLRQPLASVCLTGMSLDGEHSQLLAEEVNVETITADHGEGEWVEAQLGAVTVALRVDLSDDLKARGLVREFVRQINSLRKEQGLTVHDKVQLTITAPADLVTALLPYENVLQSAVQASAINWEGKGSGADLEVGDSKVKVELVK